MVWRVTTCINEFAEVCMLPLCRLQLLSRPHVFTVLDFNQVHMPLVYNQLVGLPHADPALPPEVEGEEEVRSNQYSIRTAGGESRFFWGNYLGKRIWRLCCANLSPLPMSVLTRPAPQGLLLRALIIILSAKKWRSAGRGHNGLVDLLKQTA
eukprot:583056-Pelagomonas_calceolata.AAC.1